MAGSTEGEERPEDGALGAHPSEGGEKGQTQTGKVTRWKEPEGGSAEP